MNAPVTRRQFLAASAVVPLGVAGVLALPPELRAGEARPRAQVTRLKPALNAFSFLELLNANAKNPSQGIDLFGVCDFCAEQGFEGVDVTGYFFPGYPQAPADDYLIRLKRRVFDLGLCFSGTGVRNDFTSADQHVRAEGVERVKAWIEVAAKLGAPTVRAFADSQPPFKDWKQAATGASREAVEAWMAEALHECAEHGEKYGVLVAVQNHGDFISTGAEHLSLLKRVDHQWCAAMVDTGKYMTADPYADIALMAPLAVNWQIKETLYSKPDGPRTDLVKVMKIVRQSGYRGYLPIETLAMGRRGYDSFAEISKMLGSLRAAIAATEPGVSAA